MKRALAGLAIAVTTVAVVSAQEPTLEVVLARAALYVEAYEHQLQGLVAEETYAQNAVGSQQSGRVVLPRTESRQLKSDLLLVKLGDGDAWLQFRDVFEVDRKPVRDRDERLYKLFVDTKNKDSAKSMAATIQEESARYNIGPVIRTINIPMLGLLFCERGVQPRVKFTRRSGANIKRFKDVADAGSVWLIEFEEVGPGAMVKGRNNLDLPSHGRLWIDSNSGRILQTEVITEDTELRAAITVVYRDEPGLDLLVPGEMREIYNMRRTTARIDGRATYSHFRRFKVTTDEKTEKPKP